MTVLGERFYRLEVHSFAHGLVVEDRADLADVLALVTELLADPPRIVTPEDIDAGSVSFTAPTSSARPPTPRTLAASTLSIYG